MKKQTPHLPSHSWLLLNKFRDWVSYAFIALILVSAIVSIRAWYILQRNCYEPYTIQIGIGRYYVATDIGITEGFCEPTQQ